MDEDIEIINTQTRNEKIKNFFINNKNSLISILVIIILALIGYFSFEEYQSSKREKLADKYDLAVIRYEADNKYNVIPDLKEVINAKDKTYSPLAFYFLLDNDLINSKDEINNYFDTLINDIGLDKKFKELTIFKKGLYNSDFSDENELLAIFNPLIKAVAKLLDEPNPVPAGISAILDISIFKFCLLSKRYFNDSRIIGCWISLIFFTFSELEYLKIIPPWKGLRKLTYTYLLIAPAIKNPSSFS